MSSSSSSLVDLARRLLSDVEAVDSYLKANQLPEPSFGVDGLRNLVFDAENVERNRVRAVSTAMELQDLLMGPRACLTPTINATSLEAVYRWKIASHVPEKGEISLQDLSTKTGLDPLILKRILRFAIVHHRCFREEREGFFSHSAASKMLVEDSDLSDTVGMLFDESWQAFARTCDALEQYEQKEPTQTGYALAHGPDMTVWDCHKKNPARGKRFARSMEALAAKAGYSVSLLVKGYPWSDLADGSILVDMGGSHGHASLAIQKSYPKLKFIVQDLPDVVQEAVQLQDQQKITTEIKFEAHDFLKEQTVQADVYLMRWILHDWPDAYVVKILQNLRTTLRPGAKVVINDTVMPKPGVLPLSIERQLRQYDLCMMSFFNAKEREEDEWRQLFKDADPRYQNIKVWTPDGAALGIIEATWTDA